MVFILKYKDLESDISVGLFFFIVTYFSTIPFMLIYWPEKVHMDVVTNLFPFNCLYALGQLRPKSFHKNALEKVYCSFKMFYKTENI